MTEAAFYGDVLSALERVQSRMLHLISHYEDGVPDDLKAIVYCKSRIKSPGSMAAKLQRLGYAANGENAMTCVHDALGIRIVCAFISDVYRVADWLRRQSSIEVVQVKDYMADPKPNGYRSYHLILRIQDAECGGITFEVQLRTIAIDCWATLEHQLKYKHKLVENEALIQSELKRCADEIAGTELSMQTLREIIRKES